MIRLFHGTAYFLLISGIGGISILVIMSVKIRNIESFMVSVYVVVKSDVSKIPTQLINMKTIDDSD